MMSTLQRARLADRQMLFRYVLVAVLCCGVGPWACGQIMPTIQADARSATFREGAILAKDGQGNNVGNISDMTITVVEDQGGKMRYSIDYNFYNGSGTWRGSQSVIVGFQNNEQTTLTQVSFPLDRGHCVYGHPEPRHVEGTMENIFSLIKSVDVKVTPVVGVQTRC